jgi:hypothetical protein
MSLPPAPKLTFEERVALMDERDAKLVCRDPPRCGDGHCRYRHPFPHKPVEALEQCEGWWYTRTPTGINDAMILRAHQCPRQRMYWAAYREAALAAKDTRHHKGHSEVPF